MGEKKREKNTVSIVVVCYNQERTIAQTLESIRYQIVTYPTEDRIQLVIADDGSKDRTTTVIERWLKKNYLLFAEVNTIFADCNQGTTKNLLKAIRRATGKYLITIAGDDMFSDVDVIKKYKENPPNGIRACVPYCFENGKLITDFGYYKNILVTYFYPISYIRKRSKFNCPVINGAIVGRDFYCERALAFSENVKFLDDQARFMKTMEILDDIVYLYDTEPILLYRISKEQVTKNFEYKQQIIKDKKWLVDYALQRTKSVFLRYTIFCEYVHLKNKRAYKMFFRFFNVDSYYNQFLRIIYSYQIKDYFDKLVRQDRVEKISEYLKNIESVSRSYIENLGE